MFAQSRGKVAFFIILLLSHSKLLVIFFTVILNQCSLTFSDIRCKRRSLHHHHL